VDPNPLGDFVQRVPLAISVACAAGAALLAALLFELSRTLAERAKGRWYAGNGRDLFHAAAAAALGAGLFVAGQPPALAAFAAAAICSIPPLALDSLPPRRGPRLALLIALLALGMAPAVLDARSVADAGNALARAAFRSRR
jgi:hypothetical protein